MNTYQPPQDPREGCFRNTAIIAVVILVSLIVLVMVIRSDAQPVASVSRETYVKPDSCFWEEIDISQHQIKTLGDLVNTLENYHGSRCARILISGKVLNDYRYDIRIRRTKGPVLELLRDAIRMTDLDIEIVPPGSVLVRRKEEGL